VLELFQAEWCPYSHRVRERMTELGVDFVVRQVAPRRPQRDELEEETGTRSIPTLKTEDGRVIEGDVEIMAFLVENYGRGEDWELGHQTMELRHPTLRQGASRDPA
jgi:glutathione S-transferase